MFPPIFALLAADATVVSLLGATPRVYAFGEADQNTIRPYVVWQTIYGSPDNYLSDRPDSDRFGTQIDVYSAGQAQARQVAEAVRNALELTAHVTSYNGEFREQTTRDYRYSFNVDWIVNR